MPGSRVMPGVRRRTETPWTLSIVGCIGYLLVITSFRIPTAIPFILLSLAGLAARANTLRVSGPQGTLLLFGVWAGISTLVSPYPQEAMAGLLLLSKVAVIGLMIAWSIGSRAQLLLMLSTFTLLFLAFPVRGTLFSYYLYKAGYFSGFGSMRAAWGNSYGNPNDLAVYCLLASGLVITLGLLTPLRWIRRMAAVAVGLLALVILLTQSRSGLLGLITVIVSTVWVLRLYRRRVAWIVGAAGVGLLLFVTPRSAFDRYLGLRNLTNSATIRSADQEGSADQRLEIMRVALGIASDHPAFGVGIGSYHRAHGEYATRLGYRRTALGQRDAHSTYLRLAAETGLFGLGLFLLAMALTVRETYRTRRAFPVGSAEHLALTMLNLTWLGFAVCALFGSMAMDPLIYVQLGFTWATSRVLRRPPMPRVGRSRAAISIGPGIGRDFHHVPVA